MSRLALIVVIAAFAVLTAYAIYDVGFWGIISYHLPSSAGWQVMTDLVIVCVLAVLWMVADARRKGRNPWPFVLLTIPLGSFGPLLYLLTGELAAARTPAPR